MALFILVKRKLGKSWIGAIPGRKGIGRKELAKKARETIRRGFTFRIVTGGVLKNLMQKTLTR